jgi:hypothetical protein
LDFDAHALAGIEASLFKPSAGELHPRVERWGFARACGWWGPLPIALRLLNGHAAFGVGGTWFKIGISHINSLDELVVVSGPYRLQPIRPALF